jgi:hypothetical protein
MTQLLKIADWAARVRINVVFVHGLGGHAYDTWRRSAEGSAFWPAWLARDIPGLAVWTLAYEAPPTNWFGPAMPIQDRAKNVLVLRAADGRRANSAEARFPRASYGEAVAQEAPINVGFDPPAGPRTTTPMSALPRKRPHSGHRGRSENLHISGRTGPHSRTRFG